MYASRTGGGQALCNFGYSGVLVEAVQLGAVSLLAGKKRLEWDSKAMRVTNRETANAFICPEYREEGILGS